MTIEDYKHISNWVDETINNQIEEYKYDMVENDMSPKDISSKIYNFMLKNFEDMKTDFESYILYRFNEYLKFNK